MALLVGTLAILLIAIVLWTREPIEGGPEAVSRPTSSPVAQTARATPTRTPRDARFFSQTGYRIDDDAFNTFVSSRGGVAVFGYPVSRTFSLLGCTTQIFQRHVLQRCAGGPVQPLNLLDPGLMPITRLNDAIFPSFDPAVVRLAPSPANPEYTQQLLLVLQATLPNMIELLRVSFYDQFMNTVPRARGNLAESALMGLEVWGFPTSRAQFDPNNRNFIYQRFQRGIMHFDATTGTVGAILIGDAFKAVITGQHLPPDLASQMEDSRFFRQYCPGRPRSLCRPNALSNTDLTLAFEPQ